MINLQLSKAEALLAFELFKANTDALLEQIMDKVDEDVTQENMIHAASENYVANLEKEVERLSAENEGLKVAPPVTKPAKKVAHKPKAPWGYKKDGTPKKRPGRATGF